MLRSTFQRHSKAITYDFSRRLTSRIAMGLTVKQGKNWINSLYILVMLSLFFACGTNAITKDFVEYSEGKQVLSVNEINRDGSDFIEPKIQTIAPDSVKIGEELLVKIFLAESTVVIADAFVDCAIVGNGLVDTVTFKVTGCKDRLFVKDDTIRIGFRPTSPGLRTFAPITIVTRDKEKIFRTMEYTFNYKVVE